MQSSKTRCCTMKFVLFVFAAFAAIQAIHCIHLFKRSIDSDASKELMNSVRERIHERNDAKRVKAAIEDICPGYGSHFENATREVQSCVGLIDESHETVCSMVQNHFKRCMMPVTNTFEECLPKPSKEVPVMMVDMILALFKHICKTDGEHIFELGNPCIIEVDSKTQKCVNSIGRKMQQYSRNQRYPSPQDVCELLEEIRSCLESHLHSACGKQITRDSFLSMYDKVLSVCKSRNHNEIEA